jgi:hypothetical protein
MIEGSDHVAVTGEVRGEVSSGATVAAAMVRVEDEGPCAGLVGAPDIAGEETIAGWVSGFEGMDADGERSGAVLFLFRGQDLQLVSRPSDS